VQAGNQTASEYSSSGLWELLGRLPRAHWPVAIRGDRDWGAQANMTRAEREDLPYLFKLRMTKGGKKIVEHLMRGSDWTDARRRAESRLRLAGWSCTRRTIRVVCQVRTGLHGPEAER